MATSAERLLAAAADLAGLGGWELDLRTLEPRWTDELLRLHGFDPRCDPPTVDTLLETIHPEDRPRIVALLDAIVADPGGVPAQGLREYYRAVRPDGSVREITAYGRVDGTSLLGLVQDVTEQRMTERELQAHYAVSQALRDWEAFEEGTVDLLRRLATALDYPMASLWLWNSAQEALVCRAFWSAPDLDPGGFEEARRRQVFRPGDSKVGQAWQRRQPVLTRDMREETDFRPREEALRMGITSTLAFPAIGYDGPIAVISLYSCERRVPSASLQRTVTSIGHDLGRFLSRRRAQFEPSPLSDRELEVVALAVEGLSGPEIAARLVVSPSTVKTHFENIYEKLGVSDRAAAVAHAMRLGLVR